MTDIINKITKLRKELMCNYGITFLRYAKKENEKLIQVIKRRIKSSNNELSMYVENILNVFLSSNSTS